MRILLNLRALLLMLLLLSSPAVLRGQTRVETDTLAGSRPGIAAALSILMPGAGQLYNGQPWKGAFHFGFFAGSIAMVKIADIGSTHESISTFGWISVATLGTAYLWAILDAAFSAEHACAAHERGPVTFMAGPLPRGVRGTILIRL